jgi:hypothetical protein
MLTIHSRPTTTVASALATLLATFAASALIAGPAVAAPPSAAASAKGSSPFTFPAATQCVRNHTITIGLHSGHGVKWSRVIVKVNGHKVKTVKRPHIGRRVTISHLPSGRITIEIVAISTRGHRSSAKRTFQSCTGGSPPPGGFKAQPGRYNGSVSLGGGVVASMYFFVSGDGARVQDLYVQLSDACSPGGTLNDHVEMDEVPIGSDGSFSKTAQQTGLIAHVPATFTYTFTGRFSGTNASGSIREDITYSNGTTYTCTTGLLSWTATLGSQGAQSTSAPPGSYSGEVLLGGGVITGMSYYVSSDGKHLQDVYVGLTLACTPGGSVNDHLELDEVPIAADGSFAKTAEQHGIVNNVAATFHYAITGHVHGASTSGATRMAGTLRESITMAGGATTECTSNNLSWNAEQPAQGAQTTAPPAGAYQGEAFLGGGVITPLAFEAPGGTQLVTIHVQLTLACIPGGTVTHELVIAGPVPIAADGSFATRVEEASVAKGAAAKFTYTFSGHFHGFATNGKARMAGVVREDVVQTAGPAYECTSNDKTWSATH